MVKYEQWLQGMQPTRKKPGHEEHDIQCACCEWFDRVYPDENFFAVANGGNRNIVTAVRLKAEGVKRGVADLILLKPNRHYNALCIEMKTRKGRQSPAQRDFQRRAERDGNKYVICRSLEEFCNVVINYFNDV